MANTATLSNTGSIPEILRSKGCAWTIDELVSVLTISKKTLYKMVATNRIPCIRMGGSIRFDPHQTAKWVEQRSTLA
jgi:excisionase family DNA binding protein